MFLQAANQGKNEWWRWLSTLVLVIAGYLIGQMPITGLLIKVVMENNGGELNMEEMESLARSMDFGSYGINPNLVLVMVLLMFVFAMLGMWIGVVKIHKRPFLSLITPYENIRWSRVFFSFGLWALLSMLLEAVSYMYDPENYLFQFEAKAFFPLLIISFVLLPIQTSFEEMFMRGYLMQGIYRWAKVPWIPLVISSLLFGSMHIMNPEVSKFGIGIMMSYYVGVGLFLGILTLMDDSLELALGVHAATNIFGALFVTFDASALQTPAIFRLQEVDVTYMIPVFFASAVFFTFICARKYGWKDWSKIIYDHK